MKRFGCLLLILFFTIGLSAQKNGWYQTVKFKPATRLVFKIKNTLDIERKNLPVVIKRADFPMPDIHEMWVTVVDPALPSYEGPTKEVLKVYGGHQMLAETNGHAIFHQLDDTNIQNTLKVSIHSR